jgi:hypothetical protein
MTEKSVTQTFPRRDADGRVVSLGELLAVGALGTLAGLVVLAVIDGILALVGLSEFGHASGWLALILPALIYFDDLRAWRGYAVRILVAVVAAGVAIGLGLVVAALASGLPPMISGAAGAMVAAVLYGLVWFVGVRWLTGQQG